MSYQMTPMAQEQKQQTVPYSGQWTKEEQDYVAILVEGFKNSTLDIPDGTSLRFFIAAKLGCKPKRVSKKYERTGYNGKQVYRRDTSVSEEKQQDYSMRLKDFEKKFKESRALVVSIQEAKIEDTTASSRASSRMGQQMPVQVSPASTTVMSAHAQALEERLIAMRSQIDQRAAGMLGRLSAPMLGQQSPMMFGNSPASFGAAPTSSAVLENYLRNRRVAMNGFTPSQPTDTNKLLLDLYRRRQQLAMAAGVVANINNRMGLSYADPPAHLVNHQAQFGTMSNGARGNKRGNMEQFEQAESFESQLRKRARAA